MLFRKSKATGAPIPIERIQEMNSVGMSDKDIIKKLKKEGYTYEEIERAMLMAIKEGVGEGPSQASAYNENRGMAPPAAERGYGAPSTLDDIYGRETAPDTMPEIPTSLPELAEGLPEELDAPSADVVLEDLIEGVIEDRWQRLTDKLESFEDKINNIKENMKHVETRVETGSRESPAKETESRMSDFNTRLEDLEARIGGLEKAFRQFLPSLTRNIESLSNIIHEMKDKTSA